MSTFSFFLYRKTVQNTVLKTDVLKNHTRTCTRIQRSKSGTMKTLPIKKTGIFYFIQPPVTRRPYAVQTRTIYFG